MTVRTLTPEAARRLAISAQRLDARPAPAPDADGLYAIVRDLGCLQLDPISHVARSHLLVLHSRAGKFDPAQVDDLLFGQRRLFEYWAHEASIVLTEDYPIHAVRMRDYPGDSAWGAAVRDWLEMNASLRQHILDHLARHGASFSREIEADGIDPQQWVSSGWTNGRNISRMLDFLWMRGEIMVSGRAGGQKRWDLSERVLPEWTPREVLAPREATRRAALRALGALGIATEMQITRHYVRRRYPELRAVLAELEREGAVVRATIAGLKGTYYLTAESLPRLEAIERGEWAGRTVLLSPFDNLICDRARARDLFGFDFTIEIYVPAEKRRYGYYVLPILHGDRLIGRIDPRYDRKMRTLHVGHVYAEPDADRAAPKTTAKAIRAAIDSLAGFLGAADVQVSPSPSRWAV